MKKLQLLILSFLICSCGTDPRDGIDGLRGSDGSNFASIEKHVSIQEIYGF